MVSSPKVDEYRKRISPNCPEPGSVSRTQGREVVERTTKGQDLRPRVMQRALHSRFWPPGYL
jgi:hypothetical protein